MILTPRSLGMSEGHGKIDFKQPKTKSNVSNYNKIKISQNDNKVDN